jgi:hypothetical protein
MKLDTVIQDGQFLQMIKPDVPMVLFDSGLIGLLNLSNVDLPTLTVEILCMPSVFKPR